MDCATPLLFCGNYLNLVLNGWNWLLAVEVPVDGLEL
jgi:hypothetical protein